MSDLYEIRSERDLTHRTPVPLGNRHNSAARYYSPMTIHGIAHIQLAIPRGGEDEARRFYSELLGLRELPKPESLLDRGGIWFQCGMQEVHCGIDDPVAPSRRHPAFLVT